MSRITNANLKMPRGFEALQSVFAALLRYIELYFTPIAVTVPYSATMAIAADRGDAFTITATNGTAFTVSNPTAVNAGKRISITIRNASGGALGVATWGSNYRLAAWTQPANGNSRTIDFISNGALWIEASRTASDVPT